MKTTFMANAGNIERKWFVVDAGRPDIRTILLPVVTKFFGKTQTYITPHVDTGDYVIVVNAAKVKVTGKKLVQKTYFRHSGYLPAD